MNDYGIKISKEGFDVTDVPTEKTKKNFVILDTTEAHKLFFKGFVQSTTYTHNLGYKPAFFAFSTDSVSSPTKFEVIAGASATTTQIIGLTNPCYIMIFYEGI